ncbi:MAG TPA: aspartate/glutamate racemase family protein [Pseudolabrys sp.]|nr:aspartate/glutamate racemase family protein [Pseudolabrys sp.]
MSKEGRCLGLIGGLGPDATVYYYRELVAAFAKHDRVLRLLIAHADYNRVYATVTAKDYDDLAHYLAGLIANMAAAGAEVSAIVAVTPHICAAQLAAISPLPLVNILNEVPQVVHARDLKRVALLGTRFTLETRMFGCLDDIEVVMPSVDEIERIHQGYVDFVTGRGSDARRGELRQLAQTFVTRDGAQAVLIAGTDLSTVFTESNAGFPMIDCARVHIQAIVQRLLN